MVMFVAIAIFGGSLVLFETADRRELVGLNLLVIGTAGAAVSAIGAWFTRR